MQLAINLEAIPGLVDALNGLTGNLEAHFAWSPRREFDLHRYQSHVEAHIGAMAVDFEEIPPLENSAGNDRVWRFIRIALH